MPKDYKENKERYEFIDNAVYLASLMVFPYSKEDEKKLKVTAYSLVQMVLHALDTRSNLEILRIVRTGQANKNGLQKIFGDNDGRDGE